MSAPPPIGQLLLAILAFAPNVWAAQATHTWFERLALSWGLEKQALTLEQPDKSSFLFPLEITLPQRENVMLESPEIPEKGALM